MIVALAVLALAGIALPFLARHVGSRVFVAAAAVALGVFVHTLLLAPPCWPEDRRFRSSESSGSRNCS